MDVENYRSVASSGSPKPQSRSGASACGGKRGEVKLRERVSLACAGESTLGGTRGGEASFEAGWTGGRPPILLRAPMGL